MDETDKKIRELTEAMRAEQDARIRNRMMAVRGILAGYPTKDAAYFADVDRRTVQLWVARFDEGGIGGLRDAPGRGRPSTRGVRADQETGRQACRQEHAHPEKASKPDTRETRTPGTVCAACAGSCASSGSRPRGLLPCMPRQPTPMR